MKKLYSNKLVIFSLVLPGVLVFLFAVLAPICLSVYYGFTDYTGMGEAHMIGWDNYVKLFHDSAFGRSLKNSLLLAIGFICIQHPLAILVAAVLDKLQGKAEGVFRCIYFIPNVISVAVIAYLWKFIYNPDFGLLNNVLKAFGYQGQINWLSQQNAIWSVLIVLIWHGFGWGMLIYYTGIKNIDPVLYEAASIDGANWWTTFFRITLPLMKPVRSSDILQAVNRVADELFGPSEKILLEPTEEKNYLVELAREYVEEHYYENLMLADVAQKAGISTGYMSTLFQKQLSKGFVDYLNEVRIEHACTYLQQNYLKTYEIAYKVGFKDEKYFSKVFKKIKGQSPSEYRKSN